MSIDNDYDKKRVDELIKKNERRRKMMKMNDMNEDSFINRSYDYE